MELLTATKKIIIIIFFSHLCKVFTIMYMEQNISLGYIMSQLVGGYNVLQI
jgi:hypothetical protein